MDKRSDPDGEPSEGVAAGGQADPTAPDQLDTDTWRAWERQFGTPQPEPVAGPSVSIGHPRSHEPSGRDPDPARFDLAGRITAAHIRVQLYTDRAGQRWCSQHGPERLTRPGGAWVPDPTRSAQPVRRRARRRLGAWLWSRVRRWWP
jgi:hypothetical protein